MINKEVQPQVVPAANKKDCRIPILVGCLILAAAITLFSVIGCVIYVSGSGGVTVLYAQSVKTVSELFPGERTISDVVDEVADSVVEINCTVVSNSYDFFGRPVTTKGASAGSGVIIAENGTVITNHHVINGAEEITIRLRNGNIYEASLVGSDAAHDIAVIRITPAETLTYATFGESAALRVGQTVIVIGNPLGTLGGTVTDGIISALDRDIKIEGTEMRLLQTNASINSGNSGGGMFDLDGRLIGIVNAKSTGSAVEGLGFAIPSDTALEIAKQILEN